MPRQSNCVQVFDEVRQIDIAWLRDKGLLKPDRSIRGGYLSWEGGSRVDVDVDTILGFVKIFDGWGVNQTHSTIQLEKRRSNLGRGDVWYFICPVSGRLCRKLYGFNGRFLSRHAFPEAMYRSQTEPKSDRRLRRFITLNGTLKKPKAEWDYSDRIKFRTHYKGNPTKRYRNYLSRQRGLKELLTSPILTPLRLEMRCPH